MSVCSLEAVKGSCDVWASGKGELVISPHTWYIYHAHARTQSTHTHPARIYAYGATHSKSFSQNPHEPPDDFIPFVETSFQPWKCHRWSLDFSRNNRKAPDTHDDEIIHGERGNVPIKKTKLAI